MFQRRKASHPAPLSTQCSFTRRRAAGVSRELRADPEQIAREVLIPTMDGAIIPLGQVAKVGVAKGAPGVRTENAVLFAYIFVDIRERGIDGYVADAKQAVAAKSKFPPAFAGVSVKNGSVKGACAR